MILRATPVARAIECKMLRCYSSQDLQISFTWDPCIMFCDLQKPNASNRISMWPLGQSSSPKVSIGRTSVMPGVSLAGSI